MRTIIAGSRGCTDMDALKRAIAACGWKPTVVISGGARGADALGEQWATENGIPVERKPADWDRYGKSAGYRRNLEMAAVADALIALWDGQSRGTKHMIDIANRTGLVIHVEPVHPL